MVGFHLLTAFFGDDHLERAANPQTEALSQGLGDSFCTEHYTTVGHQPASVLCFDCQGEYPRCQ